MKLKFSLGQLVTITASGESGIVKARAEYSNSAPSYQVFYKAADGRATTTWWDESDLTEKAHVCNQCNGRGYFRPAYSRNSITCDACTVSASASVSADTRTKTPKTEVAP